MRHKGLAVGLDWVDDEVIIEPDEFSETAVLCVCGEIAQQDDIIEIRHRAGGVTVLLPRCPTCKDVSLCDGNLYGLHSAIVTPEDDSFRDDIVFYDPDPPKPGQFFRTLIQTKSKFPNDHQYGYCSACGLPMHWSPEDFRWVDWPEATRRRKP